MLHDIPTLPSTISSDNLDHLNSFLRGELSAVETYRQAMEKLTDSSSLAQLRECMNSHQRRVTLLSDTIRRFGGEPSTSSGAWGAFAKLIEGGATLFGERAAIAALEEGEDHGLADYKRDLTDLDPMIAKFIETSILPEQNRTHLTMSQLKRLH
jgi:demethoxyubiquinone hydroxylase (CLK1/Coq7/Cat5 family)